MEIQGSPSTLPVIKVSGPWDWHSITRGPLATELAGALQKSLVTRRWFGSKTRVIRSLDLVDAVAATPDAWITIVRVSYASGPDEVYQIPLVYAAGDLAQARLTQRRETVWAEVEQAGQSNTGVLYEATTDDGFCAALLEMFRTHGTSQGAEGTLAAESASEFDTLAGPADQTLVGRLLSAEQSNSSIAYGDRVVLKLFRRVETGCNPDVELSRRLTERRFTHVPPFAGTLDYRRTTVQTWTLGMLQGFVRNQGDAWQHLLARLLIDLDQAQNNPGTCPVVPVENLCQTAARPLPAVVEHAFAGFASTLARLGTRTAEMHLALAASNDEAFAPEPFTASDMQLFCQRAGELTSATFDLLREHAAKLPAGVQANVARALAAQGDIEAHLRRASTHTVDVAKIRIHGDYHLGQVLVAGDDFMIIDFEGEPVRPLEERRRKQLALRDVAGMIRSLHYASCMAAAQVKCAPGQDSAVKQRAVSWHYWMSVAFLAAYQRTAAGSVFLPHSAEQLSGLLDACLLEKAVYELRYELNHRPDWVFLPLEALSTLSAHIR